MEHPITYCIAEDKNGLHIIDNYNAPNTEIYDSFDGTPLARRQGGFHVDLPTAEHFWRISDILNAVCGAGFKIIKVYETTVSNPTDMNLDYEPKDVSEKIEMKKLPSEFTVLAVK